MNILFIIAVVLYAFFLFEEEQEGEPMYLLHEIPVWFWALKWFSFFAFFFYVIFERVNV